MDFLTRIYEAFLKYLWRKIEPKLKLIDWLILITLVGIGFFIRNFFLCLVIERKAMLILILIIGLALYILIRTRFLKYPRIFLSYIPVYVALILSGIAFTIFSYISYVSIPFAENEKGIFVAEFQGDCRNIHCETILSEINTLRGQLPGQWKPRRLKKKIGCLSGDLEELHARAKKIGEEKGAVFVIWGSMIRREDKDVEGIYYGLTIAKKEAPVVKERNFKGINKFDIVGRELKFLTRFIVALALFDDARSMAPNNEEIIMRSIRMLEEAGELLDLNKTDYQSLYNKFQLYYYKGLVSFETGKYDDSLDYFEEARKVQRDIYFDKNIYYWKENEKYKFKIQFNIALSRLCLKNYSEANNEFEDLIQKLNMEQFADEKDRLEMKRLKSESYYHLGYMKHIEAGLDLNGLKDAIFFYRKSVDVDPTYAENHWGYYGLGSAYLEKGDFELAQDNFVRAIDILSLFRGEEARVYVENCCFSLLHNLLKWSHRLRQQGRTQKEIDRSVSKGKDAIGRVLAGETTSCLARLTEAAFRVIEGETIGGCSDIEVLINVDICREEAEDIRELYELWCSEE